MKYSLLIFIITLFLSCDEKATNTLESNNVKEYSEVNNETLETSNNLASYDETFSLLKGSWSNIIEPDSVIIFKDSTTTNMYRDMISSENVPYKIGASCANHVDIVPSTSFKYLTTYGTSQECYEIITLNDSTLVLEFKRGNITLSFNRVK